MALVVTDNKYYTEIAAAIRERSGNAAKYTPAQMAEAIRSLQGGGVLPDGYTQVDYIESSGTQYINTGFNPNNNTRVIMDAQMTKEPAAAVAIYFGVRGGGGFFELYKSGSGEKLSFLYNASYSMAFTVDYLLRRTVEINKNIATVDGVTASLPTGTFQSTLPLYLGADNEGGAAKAITAMKIYACQIYDNGTLARDFIPCRNPVGEVGLYDIVNGVFYCNAGTGTFVASLPPMSLPDGYTQVDYIESSGTQYIDTGYKPNGNTRVVVDVLHTVSNPSYAIYGARHGATSNTFMCVANGGRYRCDYNNSYANSLTADMTARALIDMDKGTLSVFGKTTSYTNATFQCAYNMSLFARNDAGTVASFAYMKLFSCQIYDNGTLVRDFVPCINAGGAYGLYDRVSGAFYGNAGTGAFTGA